MDATEGFPPARPPPCVATPSKDSRGSRNLYRNRPGRISVRTPATPIESRLSRPAISARALARPALNWPEVTWVPSGTTRPDLIRRHGDSGVSTRRQRAMSRSSSEYTRNWSGAVAPTTW